MTSPTAPTATGAATVSTSSQKFSLPVLTGMVVGSCQLTGAERFAILVAVCRSAESAVGVDR